MAVTLHRLDRWRSLASKAYGSGASLERPAGETGPARVVWDVAGSCESPVYREILGAAPDVGENQFAAPCGGSPYVPDVLKGRYKRGPIHVIELSVRCRKCAACLRSKAFYWRKRAEAEISASSGRTWFGTLTLTPSDHFRMEARARLRLERRGVRWDDLPLDEKFGERCNETGQEVTRWLKRVRKEAAVKLRYLLVAEPHKTGLPHYHILIHEVSQDGPVRHASLKRQWKLGFADFKLVAQSQPELAAAYVAKYISKTMSARVRASRGYGQQTNTIYDHSSPKGLREKETDPNTQKHLWEGLNNASELSDDSESLGTDGTGETFTADTVERQFALAIARATAPTNPDACKRQCTFADYRTSAHAIYTETVGRVPSGNRSGRNCHRDSGSPRRSER